MGERREAHVEMWDSDPVRVRCSVPDRGGQLDAKLMSKPANKSLDVVDLVRIVRRFHIPELAAALATVISVAGLFAVAVTTDRAFPLKLLIGASGAALGAVIAAALLWNRLGATGTAMHPKVFLSHESAQKDLAERIRSALILHDVRVFDPDVDISLGERIKEK